MTAGVFAGNESRTFDDPSQLKVRLETEAKLNILVGVLAGTWRLVWSCVLDHESFHNPFQERREQIATWRLCAVLDQEKTTERQVLARKIAWHGRMAMNALHFACAIHAGAAHFLTTDDKILKNASRTQEINIIDPIGFMREMTL
jgi:hypothetical protein